MKDPSLALLGAHVREELERTVVPAIEPRGDMPRRPTRSLTRSLTRTESRMRRRTVTFAAAAVLICAAAFWLGVRIAHREALAEPLSFVVTGAGPRSAGKSPRAEGESPRAEGEIGAPLVAESAPRVATFSDGSTVMVAAGARVRVAQSTARGATVLVEDGSVDAEIVHREATAWSFVAGPYDVAVTGTAFELSWDPRAQTLVLHMKNGSVVVKGCKEDAHRVVAGQDLRLVCGETSLEVAAAPPALPLGGAADAGSALSHAPPEGRSASADGGTGTATEPAADTASAAWDDAERARAMRDTTNARRALTAFRRRFPDDPRASLAAFQLGVLAADAGGDRGAALEWFSTYLEEAPNGGLAADAQGRSMELCLDLGKRDEAEKLATAYLVAHRGGPHTDLARRVLAGN